MKPTINSIFLFFLVLTSVIPASAQAIKIMSYNIHHANPPSKPGVIDLPSIVEVIRKQDPDLVALQEVDVNTGRSGHLNEAEVIAKALGMKCFFAKAIDHDGGDYGVAILSRYPLRETVVHRLPTDTATKGEPRVLAIATIKIPGGGRIRFASTHLDAQKDSLNRDLQIKEIIRIVSNERLPFILAGDLNAHPGTGIIRQLDQHFTRTCDPCAPTIPVINPKKAIDFIAFRPGLKFNITDHKVIPEQYASDHLPVIAVLEVKK